MPMTGQIRCSCGWLSSPDAVPSAGHVTCPECGLMHPVKKTHRAGARRDDLPVQGAASTDKGSAGIIVVAGSTGAVLLVCTALSWAILSADSPRASNRPPPNEPAIAHNDSGDASPIRNSPPESPPRADPQRDWYAQHVGMIVIVESYKFHSTDGKVKDADLIKGQGSCFAVSKDGILLTNRHITQSAKKRTDRRRISVAQGRLVFQKTMLIACFAETRDAHHKCTVLYESPKYDFAVLRIDRTFSRPIRIAEKTVTRGDTVELVGYPAIVRDMLVSRERKEMQERALERFLRSGQIRYFDQIPASAYEPTLTRGEVSACRTVNEEQTIQASVTVGPGNSGGPLLNESREAVGILTWGPGATKESGFGMAPALPQMIEEIKPYLGR